MLDIIIKNRSVWLQNGNFYISGAISFDFAFNGKKPKIFEKSLKFLLTNAFKQCYYVIEDLSVRKSYQTFTNNYNLILVIVLSANIKFNCL